MKIFVVSDIHGFYSQLRAELKNKGFEENNPEHMLVVCGDVFDRGPEPFEVLEYLDSLSNVILVRGNHEDLMVDMCDRGEGLRHDMSNGTIDSAAKISIKASEKTGSKVESFKDVKTYLDPFFNKFVNYFETKCYIFVHGWIPCDRPSYKGKPYYLRDREYAYNPAWRTVSEKEWSKARWINGIQAGYVDKILEPNKTIICGHWHCSYGHYLKAVEAGLADDFSQELYEFGDKSSFEPFKEEGIIAIDACTAYTGKVNVIVLEDDLLEV